MTGPLTGLHPFWFWNDRLDAAELRWQIAAMARAGVRGFMVHSRQGLGQPYLSEAWFLALRLALETAAEHGLVVWLYDEFPYPSGVAGGEVLLGQPQLWATRLHQETRELPGGPTALTLPAGKVLAALAVPLARGGQPLWEEALDLRPAIGMTLAEESLRRAAMTPYHTHRYFASDPTPVLEVTLPPGPHRLLLSVQLTVTHHKYFGAFSDVLNPAATRAWMAATHERYRERVGDYFGTVIRGVFCDETTPGWSALLPAAYQEKYGRDLAAELPALQAADHPGHAGVARRLADLRYERFVEAFERPLRAWCEHHGLLYAAEKNVLRHAQLGWSHLPGGDPGHTRAGARPDLLEGCHRGNARAVASAALWYGAPAVVVELGHSLGWGATLEDLRLVCDGMLLQGITQLVPHGFYYSTHALRKHDAPPSFFFQMPWWPHFARLSARVDRLLHHFADTRPHAPILLVDPTPGLPGAAELAAFAALQDGLRAAHRGYLIADREVLERGTWRGGELRLDGQTFALVITAPMPHPEPALLTWLAGHQAAGGRLLHLADPRPESLAAVLAEARAQVAPDLPVSAPGDAARELFVTRRVASGGRVLYFLLNPTLRELPLTLDPGEDLRELPLDEHAVPALRRLAPGRYARLLGPTEGVLLAAGERSDAPTPAAAPPWVRVTVPARLGLRPLSPNRLRLEQWTLTLPAQAAAPAQSVAVTPAPLANLLADHHLALVPQWRQGFGFAPELLLPLLRLRFHTRFELAHETRVWLALEPDTLVGDWSLRINDEAVLSPGALGPLPAADRGVLGVELTHFLRGGDNELVVDCVTDRRDGGLREVPCLLGDFGVQPGPLPRLVAPVAAGAYEDYDGNGLPHYAGIVDYEGEVTLPELPAGLDPVPVALDLPAPGGPALTLSFNGHDWLTLPWRPARLAVPRGHLRGGANHLRLRVYGDRLRAWEGLRWDEATHRLAPLP